MLAAMEKRNVVGVLVSVQRLAQRAGGGLRWYARFVVFGGALLWVVLLVQWKEPGTSWLAPLLGLVTLLLPGFALSWFAAMVRSTADLKMADDLRSLVADTRTDIGDVRQAGLINGLIRGLWVLARRKAELMEVAGKTLMSIKLVSPLGLLGIVVAGVAGAFILFAAALATLTLVL